MKYNPILKYKETIDIKAFNQANIDSIVPIVELFQENKKDLNKIDKNKKFYLNILFEQNIDFIKTIDIYIEIKITHPNIIPIIDDSFTFRNKKNAMKSMKKLLAHFDSIAFKMNGIDNYYMSDIFENLLLMVNDYSKVTMILDIDSAYKHTVSHLVNKYSSAIDKIKDIEIDINNFVLAGAIITVSSMGYSDFNGGCVVVQNKLLKAFYEISKIYQEESIFYGDYTIDEKHVFTDEDVIVTTFYPFIKYTNVNGDICVYRSESKNDHDQYPLIAKAIINSHSDYLEVHCSGCAYIGTISRGEGSGNSTGAPGTWKQNMMTHHLTTLAKILA